MRALLLLAVACAGCSDDGALQSVRYERARAARAGLYAVKAAPGGALARFVDVRLIGANIVCGTVDGQDGGGVRRFGVANGEAVIEQLGDPASLAAVEKACPAGPSRKVIGRNAAFTDISVEDEPS
jgi:hypothetical protein